MDIRKEYFRSNPINEKVMRNRDGRTTALGDGLMVIRRLFGSVFAVDALINKAISPESPYYDEDNAWELVAANIDALIP